MGKTISRTERDTDFVERITGGHHHKTVITDGVDRVERLGNTPKESEKRASESWDDKKDGGSSSSSSSGGSSKGGCYLTTACVSAMNLSDNCLELSILRNFRDKVLILTSRGRNAVREYYRIAPEIVQAVNKRENSQNIWDAAYRDIRHAVSLVLSRDFEGAFKHYQEMSLRLKEKYLD